MHDVITPRQIFKHGRSDSGRQTGILDLTGGDVNVLRVDDAVRIYHISLEILTAVENIATNASLIFDSDVGGNRTICAAVDIANMAAGDFLISECDGTAWVKLTTSTAVPHGYFYRDSSTNGTVLTSGVIRLALDATPATGAGRMYVHYKPLIHNAVITTL